ncbi:hypothetical protein ZOSMA_2G01240 [Zostera marina]|uniref:Uncharacterized protein n=1 Tax=Zostera marina TaxID=29655 RepID=A0A0K9PAX5_ZOSMR|nr:hypothetical protein ZOSMA_2G01240 [Zostera marina]
MYIYTYISFITFNGLKSLTCFRIQLKSKSFLMLWLFVYLQSNHSLDIDVSNGFFFFEAIKFY